MHEYLRDTIEKFKQKFYNDNRIIAMYLYGSGGKGIDDEYSDVDLGMVIQDGFYGEVRDGLKDICEYICGKIHLWFPEGESKESCNYAFLFEANDEQFLYDFTIMSENIFKQNTWLHKQTGRIIFDKSDIFNTGGDKVPNVSYNPVNMKWSIEQYWIYTYLNGKYFKRLDIYKLLYIQNFLFNNHMQLLHAFNPNETWTWWASDIKKLPEEKQIEMLVYFGSKTISQVTQALEKEIEIYADDAKRACEKWGLIYPQELEEYVKRHLHTMGVIDSSYGSTSHSERSQNPRTY